MVPESRELPTYEAGSLGLPVAIAGWRELISRDTVWEPHAHPANELLWNRSGVSSTTVGPRTWMITPAVGVWMPAGVVHTGRAPAGTRLRAAQFDVHQAPSISSEPVPVEVTALLSELLERLEEDLVPARSRALTEEMILDILTPASDELVVQRPQGVLLAPVVEALEADPGDRRTLNQWAVELGVSPRTVTRAFREETGLGFSRWQAAFRVHHAAQLLARGVGVEEVADLVGYRSASAFGAAFRRMTGVVPSAFCPNR